MTALFVAGAAILVGLHLWAIVDAFRTGRRWLWVIALLIVPVVSVVAYALTRRPGERAEAGKVSDDTERSELEIAHEYARAGRFELAVPHYRAAAGGEISGYIGFRLANAQLRSGDPAGALVTLDTMGRVPIQHDPEFVPLLRADVLVALGRKEEAVDVYASIMPRLPSRNAYCTYADLLIELDRRDEARVVLKHIERWLNGPGNPPGDRPAPQFRRAMEQLRDLRANP